MTLVDLYLLASKDVIYGIIKIKAVCKSVSRSDISIIYIQVNIYTEKILNGSTSKC